MRTRDIVTLVVMYGVVMALWLMLALALITFVCELEGATV